SEIVETCAIGLAIKAYRETPVLLRKPVRFTKFILPKVGLLSPSRALRIPLNRKTPSSAFGVLTTVETYHHGGGSRDTDWNDEAARSCISASCQGISRGRYAAQFATNLLFSGTFLTAERSYFLAPLIPPTSSVPTVASAYRFSPNAGVIG